MTTALLLKIGAESSSLRGELAKANGMVSQFTGQMNKVGGMIAGAFATGAVTEFLFEVSKLAAEAEGVQSAFSKIPLSTRLLYDMQEATEGTVDNLTLMKLGVQAFNNNAPLKELPEILNFIDRTADATNKDFTALAETLINNIGKQSTKGLNELGLNIQMIKERSDAIGFVPALMENIRSQSEKLGEVQSVNADRLDRLNASWQNYKIYVGEAANGTGALGTSIDGLIGIIDVAASKNLAWWEKLAALSGGAAGMTAAQIKEYSAQMQKMHQETLRNERVVKDVDKAYVLYNKNIEEFAKNIAPDHANKTLLLAEFQKRLNAEVDNAAKLVENEANLTAKLSDKKEEALLLTGASRAAINQEIKVIEDKIKVLRELGSVKVEDPLDSITRKKFLSTDIATPITAFGSLTGPANVSSQLPVWINNLHSTVKTKAPEITSEIVGMSEAVQNALAGMATGFGVAIGDMITGVGGIELLAGAVVAGFGGMAVQLGQAMIQFGVAGVAVKAFTKNPAMAIVAGVGLVALGRALSNKASSIVGGGGGHGGRSGGEGYSTESTRNSLQGNTQNIALTGEVKIRNNDLVVALTNANNRNGFTKA